MKYTTDAKNKAKGQALVEFAIILPLLMIIIVGVIEFGFVFWTQSTYVNAVRDAARTSVVIRDWDTNYNARLTEIKYSIINNTDCLPVKSTEYLFEHIYIQLIPNSSNIEKIRVSIIDQPYHPVVGLLDVIIPDSLSVNAEFRYEGSL